MCKVLHAFMGNWHIMTQHIDTQQDIQNCQKPGNPGNRKPQKAKNENPIPTPCPAKESTRMHKLTSPLKKSPILLFGNK